MAEPQPRAYAIQLIQEHWYSGVGYEASRYYLMNAIDWGPVATHNAFLDIALCTGIIGVACIVLLVGHIVLQIARTNDDLLLGIALYCLVSFNMGGDLFSPSLLMFILLIAVLNSMRYQLGDVPPGPLISTAGVPSPALVAISD